MAPRSHLYGGRSSGIRKHPELLSGGEVKPAGSKLQPAKQPVKGRNGGATHRETPLETGEQRVRVTDPGRRETGAFRCPWLSVEDGAGEMAQREV